MINACYIVFVYTFVPCWGDNWMNVGTVLFSQANLSRHQWSKEDLALLQARKHFQNILPNDHSGFMNADNQFIKQTLKYFKEVFNCIKTESPHPEVDKILTTALSDVVGGYLKLYLLPITKVFFYSGSLSHDDASKVTTFYEDIMKHLSSNGTGWHEPDPQLLEYIVSRRLRNPRNWIAEDRCRRMEDPCNYFAYIERKKDGETKIAIPQINWEDNTMFTPIRNESTFSLYSPKHINALSSYYDHAKCCVRSINPIVERDFDSEFKEFLHKQVVPHLNDQKMYIALYDVLTLVNRTRELCDLLIDLYKKQQHVGLPHNWNSGKLKSLKTKTERVFHILTTKKIIIVALIIFLELIWCCVICVNVLSRRSKFKYDCSSEMGDSCYTFGAPCSKDACENQYHSNVSRNVCIESEPGKPCKVTVKETLKACDENEPRFELCKTFLTKPCRSTGVQNYDTKKCSSCMGCDSRKRIQQSTPNTCTEVTKSGTRSNNKSKSESICNKVSSYSLAVPIKSDLGTVSLENKYAHLRTVDETDQPNLARTKPKKICNCLPDCGNCSRSCRSNLELSIKVSNVDIKQFVPQMQGLENNKTTYVKPAIEKIQEQNVELPGDICNNEDVEKMAKNEGNDKLKKTQIQNSQPLKTYIEIQIEKPRGIGLAIAKSTSLCKIPRHGIKKHENKLNLLTAEQSIFYIEKSTSPIWGYLKDVSVSSLTMAQVKHICTEKSSLIHPLYEMTVNSEEEPLSHTFIKNRNEVDVSQVFITKSGLEEKVSHKKLMTSVKGQNTTLIMDKSLKPVKYEEVYTDNQISLHSADEKNNVPKDKTKNLLSPSPDMSKTPAVTIKSPKGIPVATSKCPDPKRMIPFTEKKNSKYSVQKLYPQSLLQSRELLSPVVVHKQTVDTVTNIPTKVINSEISNKYKSKTPLPTPTKRSSKLLENQVKDTKCKSQILSNVPETSFKTSDLSPKTREKTTLSLCSKLTSPEDSLTEGFSKTTVILAKPAKNPSSCNERSINTNDASIQFNQSSTTLRRVSPAPNRKLKPPEITAKSKKEMTKPSHKSRKLREPSLRKVNPPEIVSNYAETTKATSEMPVHDNQKYPHTNIANIVETSNEPQRTHISDFSHSSKICSREFTDIVVSLDAPEKTPVSPKRTLVPIRSNAIQLKYLETKSAETYEHIERAVGSKKLSSKSKIKSIHSERTSAHPKRENELSPKLAEISFEPIKITLEPSILEETERAMTFPERISKSLGNNFENITSKPRGILKFSKRAKINDPDLSTEVLHDARKVPHGILNYEKVLTPMLEEPEYPVSRRPSRAHQSQNASKRDVVQTSSDIAVNDRIRL